jgi:hypothetical protein
MMFDIYWKSKFQSALLDELVFQNWLWPFLSKCIVYSTLVWSRRYLWTVHFYRNYLPRSVFLTFIQIWIQLNLIKIFSCFCIGILVLFQLYKMCLLLLAHFSTFILCMKKVLVYHLAWLLNKDLGFIIDLKKRRVCQGYSSWSLLFKRGFAQSFWNSIHIWKVMWTVFFRRRTHIV